MLDLGNGKITPGYRQNKENEFTFRENYRGRNSCACYVPIPIICGNVLYQRFISRKLAQ